MFSISYGVHCFQVYNFLEISDFKKNAPKMVQARCYKKFTKSLRKRNVLSVILQVNLNIHVFNHAICKG